MPLGHISRSTGSMADQILLQHFTAASCTASGLGGQVANERQVRGES